MRDDDLVCRANAWWLRRVEGGRTRTGVRTGAAATVWAIASLAPLAAQELALPDTLDLERAISVALEQSPDVRSARAAADAAGASRRAAWGSFLPTASLSVGLNRSDFTKTTFLSEEGTSEILPEPLSSASQSASQGLGLNWVVFDQGRRFATLRQEGANVRVVQRQLDDRRATVVLEASQAYYDALRAQRLLELTERQVADREQELDIARRRYEIAAVERVDVLAAESNLLEARVNVLTSRRQTETQLRGLAVAMGLPPDAGRGTFLRDIGSLPDAGALEERAVVERVMTRDPEILQLEARQAAASAGLWGARSSYLPRITASVNWSRGQQFGPDESFFQFDPSDTGRSFSISASWTLFDGFQREQQTVQASSEKRQAEEELRRLRLEIERDVLGYLDEIAQLDETLALAERSFAIAEERLNMTRQMYQNGTIDFTALQQAVSQVTVAERQLIDLRYNYLIAWANLEQFGGDAP